jgi:maltooligosyltrehalose trehalohydrolase
MSSVKASPIVGRQHSPVGASLDANGIARFCVWAPRATKMELNVLSPAPRIIPMKCGESGYFEVSCDDLPAGSLYMYRIDGQVDRPDPASRRQPQGVHGPSELVEIASSGAVPWRGLELADYIVYELHVGTFTPDGTIDAVADRLDRLQELGVTAIELMPVAEFPGERNWGYDGVYPYAVHRAYGTPQSLRRLSSECHKRGMALVLDVVYNHLGPEGNYLRDFGPYFTDRYRTPWGDAINFEGAGSDHVRRLFIDNALYWIEACGVDALRLDAVHAIYDRSAYPFLQELAETVHAKGRELVRRVYLIAESDLNDARLLLPSHGGGYGLDAQWSDDFHHSLHTLLTGERIAYYEDFGEVEQLAKAYRDGWVYAGQYSRYRRRRFGNSPARLDGRHFVVCAQNHDQVGNRMQGERIGHLVDFEAKKLAAAAVLLSPFLPLLFMGEEYDDPSPFLYFVDHSDSDLVEAVRQGRRAEFADFVHIGDPPDPSSLETFERCKLREDLCNEGVHRQMWSYYQELIRIRKWHPALRAPSKCRTEVICAPEQSAIIIRRSQPEEQAAVLLHFGTTLDALPVCLPRGEWTKILDSSDERWGGPGSRTPTQFRTDGQRSSLDVASRTAVVFTGRVR